jgi:hypothetical protein
MTTVLEHKPAIDADEGRMQWRGSHDGIVWTPWSVLTHLHMILPEKFLFVHGRLWVDGAWCTSPVSGYDEDWQ